MTMASAHRRRRSALALLLAITAAASQLLVSIVEIGTAPPRRSRAGDEDAGTGHRRSLLGLGPSSAVNPFLSRYADPKSVEGRAKIFGDVAADDGDGRPIRRTNCQVIYVLGVEGSIHHGFIPVITALAEQQLDPVTGMPYHIVKGHEVLRNTIFGNKEVDMPQDDPDLVMATVEEICPHPSESWKKHVILEGASFPSGNADNVNLQFRVRRQKEWIDMTPEEIANHGPALDHPTNLHKFYKSFSPYLDVRFIVLHRPYLETVASHPTFDTGPVPHSKVITGYMMLLSRFLTGHLYGPLDGDMGQASTWTIVCAGALSTRQYENEQQLHRARQNVLNYLVDFLGWSQRSCPACFDGWRESAKTNPPEERLGEEAMPAIMEHVGMLEGIWPPRREEDGSPEQQCHM